MAAGVDGYKPFRRDPVEARAASAARAAGRGTPAPPRDQSCLPLNVSLPASTRRTNLDISPLGWPAPGWPGSSGAPLRGRWAAACREPGWRRRWAASAGWCPASDKGVPISTTPPIPT